MRIIAKKALVEFWRIHPDSKPPLVTWHSIVSKTDFKDPHHVHYMFPRADFLPGDVVIFDIGGRGKGYRLSVRIVYRYHLVYVRHVMTHDEYERRTRNGML